MRTKKSTYVFMEIELTKVFAFHRSKKQVFS